MCIRDRAFSSVGLLLAIVAPAGFAGFLVVRSRRHAASAMLAWLPAAVWFAILFFLAGSSDHRFFWNLFVGDGFCGDLACVPQFYATAPLLACIAYSLAAVIQG